MICIIIATSWNIIWVTVTDIDQIESHNKSSFTDLQTYRLDQLSVIDEIFFWGEAYLSYLIYYLIILSGPLDICKMLLLRENKKIFGILLCFIGWIKLTLQGLFFDVYLSKIVLAEFIYERLIAIFFHILAAVSLIAIVKEEMSEIFRAQ